MIEFCKMLFQANFATNRRCRNAVLITLLFWCAIASITLWMYANDGEIFWAGLPLAIFVPMALEDAFCCVVDMGDGVLLFIALCAASPSVPWFLFFLMGSAALYMGIHTLCVASAEEALHQDRQNTAPMWKFAFPLLPFFGFGLFVYGLPVLVLSQNIPAGYAEVDSIAANCGTHIYYAPNLEPEGNTAKAISMTLGKETITVNSQSHNGGLWKSSTSTSQTGRDLMTPDEVMKLPYEKSIIFRTGQKPILADKLFWFDQPYFKWRQLSPALLISDYGTKILTFDDLVNVRGKEVKARQEKKEAIRREKEKCGNKEENVKGKERANLTSLMPTPSEKETSSPDEESSTLMKAAEKTNKDEPIPSRMADRAAAVFAAVNDEPKMYTVETKRWEKAAEPLALQSTFKHLEGEDEMMMDEKEMSQDRAEERGDMSDMMDTDMPEDQAFMEVKFDAEEERAFEVPPDFVVEEAEEDAGDEALFED